MEVVRLYSALLSVLLMVITSSQNEVEFHIGSLIIDLSFKDVYSYKTAIDFAVETVHNKSVLPAGHKLVVHHKGTRGRPDLAIDSLLHFRQPNSSKIVCIVGPATSGEAVYTARLANVWGPLQVSYGASTPALLDDAVYHRFLTIVPTAKSLNKGVVEMLKYFKWSRIALAYDVNQKEFILPTMNALQVELQTHNFNVIVDEGISLKKKSEITQLIEKLKARDARIVIALFLRDEMRQVLCEAYHQGFYGKKIIWISYLMTFKFHNTDKNCNTTQFNTSADGMFVANFKYLRADENKTISDLSVKDFEEEMQRRHPLGKIGEKSSLAFDTIWLLALTLNASIEDVITLKNRYFYKRYDFELLQKIKQKMISIEFEGISGNVRFNETERLGTVVIQQRRGVELVDVAQHYTRTNVFTFFPNQSSPRMLFEGTKYPTDGPTDIYQVQHYSSVLFIAIWIFCALAITIAIGMFYFNFKNREIRYIKMSSPHVNNLIIFGGLLCYVKVILDTLDSRFMSLDSYGKLCNFRVWIMSLGFTLAFGSMFSKTWRVHRIFTASKNFRRAVIKNFHLYGLLLLLLAVDVILLTMWMIMSPYKSDILTLPEEADKENDKVFHPSIYYCTSKFENYFLITTLGYKGLLLIFGIFLAWETRNIEIKALNDSKYIGISVYNVVILSVVGVIIASLMAGTKHYNVYLALMSLVVILCTAATLGIVFIPKIIGLQRVLTSTANDAVETSYTTSSGDAQGACCCCEKCKCRCSTRKTSVHVSNKFLASASTRKKSRQYSVPDISVTKPKTSVHVDPKVSLSSCPLSDCQEVATSLEESPRVGFLSTN